NEGTVELRNAAGFDTPASARAVALNGASLRLFNDTATTFGGALTVNADSTIAVSRATAAATPTTHTVGTLSIGGGRVLSVNSNNINSGTSYGLTTGAVTLTGAAAFDVSNNGTGTGTMTIA